MSKFNEYLEAVEDYGKVQEAIDMLAKAQDSDDIKQIKETIRYAVTLLQRARLRGEIK